jgi:hypothetical protein
MTTLCTLRGVLLNCVRKTNPSKSIFIFHNSNTRTRTCSTDYVWHIWQYVMADHHRVRNIEPGIGIYTYYIYPHCWRCMSSAFSHFSSPRRLGVSRGTTLGRLLTTTLFQYISIKDKGKVGEILNSWPHKSEARISVVTDGVSGLTFS